MASSSSAAASSAPLHLQASAVPPLPAKIYMPQRKGNIGKGKLYPDEAAFQAAVQACS